MSIPNELGRIIDLTVEHNTWRRSSLNMIPSENVMSPLAEAVYMCDMMHRYAEGRPRRRLYQGLKYVDEVEELVMDLMS
ncbi:MAG: serine hydroxymethyltransferase, partial [Sulfolobales archaeon]